MLVHYTNTPITYSTTHLFPSFSNHKVNNPLVLLLLRSHIQPPASINSPSLSDGPRPGKAEINGQLGCGTGAKSLDRDLGDVYTWPHSHYLMRLCNGVGGLVRLK